MVRALRKRPRPDTLASQKRKASNGAGRTVYLVLLALFALAVLDYLFGDFLLLRADGLVLRDRTLIAATYVARVEEVAVREGRQVRQGEVLLRLRSGEMLERLADLSTRRAQLSVSALDFAVRAANVAQLLPLARKRDHEAGKMVAKYDALSGTGLGVALNYDGALRASFDARQDQVRLTAQGEALEQELETLRAARRDVEVAFANLRQYYADGVVAAPASGAVGAEVPSVGDVYRAGEPMLSIYSGEPHVLVFLPRRYLFPIEVGQVVEVSDGRLATLGVIAEILPVTDTLPQEFQNTFKPADRSQLAEIRFAAPPPFPLHQKVEITRGVARIVAELLRGPRAGDGP